MDDFLTETWFIVLLGIILAIIIMSFAAMVFVKRKHMMMKQGSLGKCNFLKQKQDKLKMSIKCITFNYSQQQPPRHMNRNRNNNPCQLFQI